MLHRFGLREGSAGLGKWRGGEGVVRELEVLQPLQMSILSEVCVFRSNYWTEIDISRRNREELVNRTVWKAVDLAVLAETPGSNNREREMEISQRLVRSSRGTSISEARLRYRRGKEIDC
jgi:hypothetical protein